MRRPIAVCDCETDPFRRYRVPKPFIWGYYDGTVYKQFRSTNQFVAFLKEQPAIVYAHNGGKFDWHFILPSVNPYSDIMLINGRIAKMEVGRAECRDSYNIIPVPLREYKKDDIDYSIMEESERYKPENWKQITKYLRSDCVYLYELVSRFINDYGVQLTQASAAMRKWKQISKEPIPRTNKAYYDFFKPFYYGGRVECFESGIIDDDFEVYDINSAYPFAMLNEHPYGTTYSHIEGYDKDADFYVVRCKSVGAFPYRFNESDAYSLGLSFPNDGMVRDFSITHWEFDCALEFGQVSKRDVRESITFDERKNFREYIEHFYELRLKAKAEKDDAGSLFAKLLMNSLYGKFGANPENYEQHIVVPMDVIGGLPSAGWQFAGEFGPWGLGAASLPEAQQRYYNVAISASITGFVRAMLWKAIYQSKGVLYCDTDSIAVRKRSSNLTISDSLGAWKSEGTFDRAGIAGKKLYIFRSEPQSDNGKRVYKSASKGVRLTNNQLWALAKGAKIKYIPEVPTFSARKAPTFTPRNVVNTHVRQQEISRCR
jgi:hypothetical protein